MTTPTVMPRVLIPLRYVRVRHDGKSRLLVLTTDNANWFGGYEVGKDGGRIEEYVDGVDCDRLHLIHRSAIAAGEVKITPMTMNKHFGELEKTGKTS